MGRREYLDPNHEMVQSEAYGFLRLGRLVIAYEMVSCFVIVFTHDGKIQERLRWHDVRWVVFYIGAGVVAGSRRSG